MSGEKGDDREMAADVMSRVANYPDVEGWAPETYLERIPNR